MRHARDNRDFYARPYRDLFNPLYKERSHKQEGDHRRLRLCLRLVLLGRLTEPDILANTPAENQLE